MEAPVKVTIEAVLSHEYFLCFYGVIIWYLLLMIIENKTRKNPFDFKVWWRLNRLDVAVTLAIAPLMVVFDDEVVNLYNSIIEKDIQIGKLVYLCAGPAYNFLIRLATGFIKK